MIIDFNLFESSLASTLGKAFSFEYDTTLPTYFYISSLDKRIKVKWHHHPVNHNIIERMKRYQRAESVSDYLRLIQKSFSDIFPLEEEIKKDQKYCIYLMDRKFYILFKLDGTIWYPSIEIITILPHEPVECYVIFEVDDTYYLI